MGIIIRDKRNGTCLVLDIATLEAINLINKVVENILKHKPYNRSTPHLEF